MIALPVIPHNFEAEQALLGSILVNNGVYGRVSEFLRAEHFVDPVHGRLYGAIGMLIDRGQAVSAVTLKTYLERDEDLLKAGGTRYISDLTAASVHVVDAAVYGRLVKDLYLRRKLIEIGEDLVAKAYQPTPDVEAMNHIEAIERDLYELADGGGEGEAKAFSALLTEAVKETEIAHKRGRGMGGIATGFRSLDQLLGGLHKSDLIILAARPSMGKTAMAMNIAFNVARAYREAEIEGQRVVVDGAAVGIFSLEMSGTQLTNRLLAEQAEIPSHKVRSGDMNPVEWDRYLNVNTELQHLKLFVDATPALTISALRTRARRLKRQHNIGLFVIDYLQMMRGSANVGDGRVQEASEISRGLKALAKELDVPVLALSQLSRAVEGRTDKHPQLSDLRDSGTIEQDADVVIFLYREEYYIERSNKKNSAEHIAAMGLAEVDVAKQRHGPIGTIPMRFNGAYTKFSDVVDDNA